MTTARRAAAALGWNYGGAAASVVLQLGYTAWTARTAAHGDFGQYAIALTLAQLLGLFATAGLATCVLRAERLTRALLRATLGLGLATGTACCLLLMALAPLGSDLWNMPQLTDTLRLLGLQYLVLPAGSVLLSALRRAGDHRYAVGAELAGQVVGCAASAACLLRSGSPLALALSAPVAALATLLFAALPAHRLPLPAGEKPAASSLVGLSGFLSGFALLRSAAGSAPLWTAGLVLGPAAAGLYSRAQLLCDVPLNFVVRGLNQAAVPVFAQHQEENRPLARPAQYLLCAASAGLLAFGALAGAGPALLSLLLGPGWQDAAALVPALALCAALQLLYAAGCSLDLARGARRDLVRTQLVLIATTAAALALAARHPDPVLITTAASAGLAAGHGVQLLSWHRQHTLDAAAVLRAHLAHGAAGTALTAAGLWGGGANHSLPGALLAMAPVLLAGLLLRDRLPAYRAAAGLGLLKRTPTPAATTAPPALAPRP